MVHHARGLHHTAQLRLAPVAARARGLERGHEGGGLVEQVPVVLRGRAQLLAQAAELRGAVPLQHAHLLLEGAQLPAQRGQGLQHAGLRAGALGVLRPLLGQGAGLGAGAGQLLAHVPVLGAQGVQLSACGRVPAAAAPHEPGAQQGAHHEAEGQGDHEGQCIHADHCGRGADALRARRAVVVLRGGRGQSRTWPKRGLWPLATRIGSPSTRPVTSVPGMPGT